MFTALVVSVVYLVLDIRVDLLKKRSVCSDLRSHGIGPGSTGCVPLGDIVISLEHAQAQAEEFGHSFEREVAYLTVHSMLHLLGYDHEAGGLEQVRMREREEGVLKQLGLPRGTTYVLD